MSIQNLHLLIVFFIVFFQLMAFGAADSYVVLSTVKARPLAMGGAFTAVVDDIAAIDYNPAAFSLYQRKHGHRLTFFLNPVSPVAAGLKRQELYQGNGSKADDFLLSLGLVLKSISLSVNAFEIGLLLGEESLNLPNAFGNRDEAYKVSGFKQNHTHSFFGRLKLADQVSIGATASLMYGSTVDDPLTQSKNIGISYGILLQLEKGLHMGVSLIDLPDSLRDNRFPLERIVDESINVGLSYELYGSKLSIDVRNLGEEQHKAVREFHVGFEQILFSHFALRAGWFKRKEGSNVYSCGIGIFDGNRLVNSDKQFGHRNYYFNYAFIYDDTETSADRWHLLSFYLRL